MARISISMTSLERGIYTAFGPVRLEREMNSASVWLRLMDNGFLFELDIFKCRFDPQHVFGLAHEIFGAVKLFERGNIVWC